jgi:hypothetical protein
MNPLIIGAGILGALMVLKNKGGMSLPGTSVSNNDIGFGGETITSTPSLKIGSLTFAQFDLPTIGGVLQGNALGSNDSPSTMTPGAVATINDMTGANIPIPKAPESSAYTVFSQYNVPDGMTAQQYQSMVQNNPDKSVLMCFLLNSPMGGGGTAGNDPNLIKVGNYWAVKNNGAFGVAH